MDEEQVTQDQAQNVDAVEDNSVSAPPADEPNTSEPVEPAGEPAPVAEAVEEQPEAERKPSRAERRIRQLSEKVKQQEQSNQFVPSQGQSPQFPNYSPDEEITPERLQSDVVQTAQAIADLTVSQRLSQDRAVNNFERDQEILPTKYDILNPDSDNYNEEVEKAIAEEFQERAFRVVGYDQNTGQPITQLDPSVRLSDIAARYAKVAEATAKQSSSAMRNSVAQVADTSAVRPTQQPKTDKTPGDMSIEELEAKYGFAEV